MDGIEFTAVGRFTTTSMQTTTVQYSTKFTELLNLTEVFKKVNYPLAQLLSRRRGGRQCVRVSQQPWPLTPTPTPTPTHSLPLPLSLTHSLTHSRTHLLTHLLAHWRSGGAVEWPHNSLPMVDLDRRNDATTATTLTCSTLT